MNTTVENVITSGDLAALKRLVASGEVPDGDQPLHQAAMRGHLDMVRYLMEEVGANPRVRDNYGRSSLHIAVFNGRLEVVRYLIEERGMDPTEADPRVGLKGHELG